MVGDEVLNFLESANWDHIILELTRYAIWQARKHTWSSGDPSILPKGNTPQDMALNAIKKVWSGQREWDPKKYPDLLLHLKWVVKSDINHLSESLEHEKVSRLHVFQSDETLDSDHNEISPKSLSPTYEMAPNPEEELILSEKRKGEKHLLERLHASVRGDDDLELLFMCFEDGIDKPRDIARETGFDIEKVYKLKKKLYRKTAKIGKFAKNGNVIVAEE
jgi:hypothetical protein